MPHEAQNSIHQQYASYPRPSAQSAADSWPQQEIQTYSIHSTFATLALLFLSPKAKTHAKGYTLCGWLPCQLQSSQLLLSPFQCAKLEGGIADALCTEMPHSKHLAHREHVGSISVPALPTWLGRKDRLWPFASLNGRICKLHLDSRISLDWHHDETREELHLEKNLSAWSPSIFLHPQLQQIDHTHPATWKANKTCYVPYHSQRKKEYSQETAQGALSDGQLLGHRHRPVSESKIPLDHLSVRLEGPWWLEDAKWTKRLSSQFPTLSRILGSL